MSGPVLPTLAERAELASLLGRPPAGAFSVVRRSATGGVLVVENVPWLDDGTPMPTLYWLVDPELRRAVGRLEAAGGVRQAEAAVPPEELAAAHAAYAALRQAAAEREARRRPLGLPPGPWPRGGVGGTRRGVKCLHAHLAFWLVGGPDPVGAWTADRLGLARDEETVRGEETPTSSRGPKRLRVGAQRCAGPQGCSPGPTGAVLGG